VPTVYVRHECGVETVKPDDIVRSNLKGPFLYGADATLCCGCGRHVPYGECRWAEAGENLQKSFGRLRA
jgi:hypothetical protein